MERVSICRAIATTHKLASRIPFWVRPQLVPGTGGQETKHAVSVLRAGTGTGTGRERGALHTTYASPLSYPRGRMAVQRRRLAFLCLV